MFINKDIPENDKIILNKLGKNADAPISDLLLYTHYKRKSSIYNRIRNLREEKYLFGPYFTINYNAIGKNKLYSIFVFANYNPVYRAVVLEAMKKIDCYTMIYPVRTADMYIGIYRCNNWNYLAKLFNQMKTWGWLKEYTVRKSEYKWIIQNPDFFGALIPPPDYEISQGELPCFCYQNTEDVEVTTLDLIVLKYLSVKPYHLSQIRDIEYQYREAKLRYSDLKKSYEKLIQHKILLEKNFVIFPLPLDMCSLFFFVSSGKHFESHLELINYFGKDLRVNKTLIVVGKEIISYFLTHPLLEGRILGILGDALTVANMYGVKTYPSSELSKKSFNDNYFDLNDQKWTFPYSTFREELKKLKEKNEKGCGC